MVCTKLAGNELETVRVLMSMSLNALVADTLDVDLEDLAPGARLGRDLGMDDIAVTRLATAIAEMFDGAEIEIQAAMTMADLLERVVNVEFAGLEEHLPPRAA